MTKRPLCFAAICFVAGILMALFKINILILVILGAVLAVTAFFCRKQKMVCFLLFLCCLLGVFASSVALREKTSVINRHYGTQRNLVMTVTDFSNNGKVIAEFKDNKDKIRIYLNVKTTPSFVPGQIIEGDVSIYTPSSSKTTHNDFSSYLSSRGVYLYGIADSVEFHPVYEKGFMGRIYACRRYINKVGKRAFSSDTRALFNAMVLGDKSLLSGELYSALQGSGLNHIAVVSGMHLSILIGAVMVITNILFGKLRAGNLVSVAFAFVLMFITGAGASVIRAFIMCALYYSARVLYRESDSFTSLGFAVFIMLFINPFLIHNPGFILSVLSVMGILLFYNRFSGVVSRFVPEKVVGSVSLTLSASVGVMAAVVYYFGIITPYAVLSNLLVFVPSTVFVVAGMAFSVLHGIPFVGTATGFIIKLLSKAIISICYSVSALPGAIVSVQKYTIVFISAWLLAFAVLLMKNFSQRKRIYATAVLILTLAVGVFSQQQTQMRFFSAVYGQSTMTKVSLNNGREILIDCPDSYDARYMEEGTGKPFLWAVLTTKNHEEMLRLAQNGNLQAVIVPDALFSEKEKEKFMTEWKRVSARAFFLPDGKRIGICGAQIEFLPTDCDGRAVKLCYGKKTFISLQGADSRYIEKLFSSGEKLDCDYLKLPFFILPEGLDAKNLTDGKIVK